MKKTSFIHYLCLFVGLSLALTLHSCGGGGSNNAQTQQEGTAADGSTASNEDVADTEDGKSSTKGCNLDQDEFDKAEVFEPLDPKKTTLPARVSLEEFIPKVKSQGQQGSCTAWATAYYARTTLEAAATGADPNSFALSPAFLYNQLAKGNCQGTNIRKALELVQAQGLSTLKTFPYSDADCSKQPSGQAKQEANQFKLRGFNRLTRKDNDYKVDPQAIKQNLAQGAPVVIGIPVGGSFYTLNGKVWKPTPKDYKNMKAGGGAHVVDDGEEAGFGGHAMCIIGYDDQLEGGSFQIVNSWGDDWADGGKFWMPYKDFEAFCNEYYGEAYGLFPLPKKKKVATDPDFKVSVGLVKFKTDEYLPLTFKSGNTFTTDGILPKKTAFKIEVTNSVECYTYVFGQETDGSSYVLFPYTPKHSPFCGITGTRRFPKDFSMQLDEVGAKDYMAVVVTKEPIDFDGLNKKISASSGASYEAKIKEALGNTLVDNVKFAGGATAAFEAMSANKNAVLLVMEINKK